MSEYNVYFIVFITAGSGKISESTGLFGSFHCVTLERKLDHSKVGLDMSKLHSKIPTYALSRG